MYEVQEILLQHQNGESKSTKKYLPIVLLYSQYYETIAEAIHMETKIKRWKNKKMIESFMQI